FMDIWLETRRANLNDRNRMCYAATFFREAALTWFHSLTIVNPPAPGQQVSGGDVCNNEGDNENDEDHNNMIHNYTEFRDACKKRFKRQPEEEREAVARPREIRQTQRQTTANSVNQIRQTGDTIRATENDEVG